MSTRASKKAKLEDLPICPYGILFVTSIISFVQWSIFLGGNCYRKNPEHFKEYSHADGASTSTATTTVQNKPSMLTLEFLSLSKINCSLAFS